MNNLRPIVFLVAIMISFRGQAAAPQQSGKSEHTIESGMWLCLAPLPAVNLWNDLSTAQKTGVTVKASDIDHIAQNYGCEYFGLDNFKITDIGSTSSVDRAGLPPIKVVGGNVGDAKTGWVSSQEYIQYMRYHVVRKP